jgi:hypothetical protein
MVSDVSRQFSPITTQSGRFGYGPEKTPFMTRNFLLEPPISLIRKSAVGLSVTPQIFELRPDKGPLFEEILRRPSEI